MRIESNQCELHSKKRKLSSECYLTELYHKRTCLVTLRSPVIHTTYPYGLILNNTILTNIFRECDDNTQLHIIPMVCKQWYFQSRNLLPIRFVHNIKKWIRKEIRVK